MPDSLHLTQSIFWGIFRIRDI